MLNSLDRKVLSLISPYADHTKKVFQSWATDEDGYSRFYRVFSCENSRIRIGIFFTKREEISFSEVLNISQWEVNHLKDNIPLLTRILNEQFSELLGIKDAQALVEYVRNL